MSGHFSSKGACTPQTQADLDILKHENSIMKQALREIYIGTSNHYAKLKAGSALQEVTQVKNEVKNSPQVKNQVKTKSGSKMPGNKMKATVKKGDDGSWYVVVKGKAMIACDSNGAAWRMADKINNEPMSSREEITDWASRKTS